MAEVLSLDDLLTAVREKLEEYKAWGVPHVWLADPHGKRLYVCEKGLMEVSSLKFARTRNRVAAGSSLRLTLQSSALQSEVRGSGKEMAVVGPDFVESGRDGGYDVNGVPGAKRRRFGEASGEEFHLAQDMIRYRNQSPPFVG